jgi:transposase-like protein
MSEEQLRVARRRRTPAEAAQLVAEYQASQLSKREFCRERGVAVSTLEAYRSGRRLARPKPAQWMEVEVREVQSGAVEEEGSGLALVLAKGRKIEVSRSFDTATLAQLLNLLERD